ncbi:hypothetical protein [Amycolatopsis sp. NPDC004169]
MVQPPTARPAFAQFSRSVVTYSCARAPGSVPFAKAFTFAGPAL